MVCCSVIDNCYTQRDTDTGEVGGGGRLTLGKRERKREGMKTQLRKQSGEMKEMEETASKRDRDLWKETDRVVGRETAVYRQDTEERETEIVKKDTGSCQQPQLSFQLTVSINCQPREEVILGVSDLPSDNCSLI